MGASGPIDLGCFANDKAGRPADCLLAEGRANGTRTARSSWVPLGGPREPAVRGGTVNPLLAKAAMVFMAMAVTGSFIRRVAGHEERLMYRQWKRKRTERERLTNRIRKEAANGR